MDFDYLATLVIDGIVNGSIYGLFGVCLVVIFRSNHIFNFCLTQLATLIILLVVEVLKFNVPFYVILVPALIVSFLIGSLLHISVMRIITERKRSEHTNQALLSIGLLAIFDGVSNFSFKEEPASFPSLFSEATLNVGGLNIPHQSIGVALITWMSFIGVQLLFKKSNIGMKMEAVAENISAARLRGIRASNVLAFAWGLTTAMSVLGGLLIAPIVFVFPQMLIMIFSYSLIAAVIGGLESPVGAIIGGILIGVVENVGSQFEFVGSDLKFPLVFVLLLVVMVIRPRGLWGRLEARRV